MILFIASIWVIVDLPIAIPTEIDNSINIGEKHNKKSLIVPNQKLETVKILWLIGQNKQTSDQQYFHT